MRTRIRPLPSFLCFLVAQTVVGQVAFEPRRICREFAGDVPMLWTLEGTGSLKSVTLRIVDEAGREVAPSRNLVPVRMGSNRYQVTDLWRPAEACKTWLEGSYVLEWDLRWEREGGGVRPERLETGFRLEETGGGWLQRAYLTQDGSERLVGSGDWPSTGAYALRLEQASTLRRVRYQVIDGDTEKPLRAWTELPLDKGSVWSLPGDGRWGNGAKVLWLWIERGDGSSTVLTQEIGGKGQGGITGGAGTISIQPVSASAVLQGGRASLVKRSLAATASELIEKMDSPSLPGGWAASNRVATVQVGYLDEERGTKNPDGSVRLWPSLDNRPISLSVEGSDLLAKPVFSVSYLLDERAGSAGRDPLDIAFLAVGTASGPSFPPGAKQLQVGGVTTPVVFKAGHMEDFLGKPLVGGYGWAASDASGVVQSAQGWVRSLPGEPSVGLDAIKKAAVLRARIIEDAMSDAAYAGDKAQVRLNEQRQPFGITLASQDPTGRPVLSRPLGARFEPGEVLPFGEIKAQKQQWTQTFDGSTLPLGITADGHWGWDTTDSQPALVLQPQESYLASWDDRDENGQTHPYTQTYEEPCGQVQLPIGLVYPQAQISLSIQISGPFEAKWVVDGQEQTAAVDSGGHLDTAWLTTRDIPVRLALRIRNSRVIDQNGAVRPEDAVRINQFSMDSNLGMAGLEIDEDRLDALTSSRVPGFTYTQYGTVEIEGQGTCTVSMVTDPDGSAVAEVKDPEGRTVYKIVNPTRTYTDQFRDFRGKAFLPAAPRHRGAVVQAEPMRADVQQDLVTQYVFDSEGHLRVVIPPKGLTWISGEWGYAPDHALLVASLAWNPSASASPSLTPLPYATHNAYDASGHLVATHNPDEGITRFWVDQKGRAYYSQTEGQRRKSPQTWTRTYYDQIFRVVAVGETTGAPGTNFEIEGVVPANESGTSFSALATEGLSRNLYDAYVTGEDDPLAAASNLPQAVRDLLPAKELWERFPDGHLTLTFDGATRERYFYDQDGRVVIRWVSLLDGRGAWQHHAVGIYYDFAGRVKRIVYPSGPSGDPLQVVYTYDELGRLFAVGTLQDKAYFARYAYQPTGEIRSVIYGPGEGFVAKRMVQDPQGWLRSLTIQGK
ncbi:hypothetical protein [Geothrix sp. 21YS21S-4]|uniref:hypothetical protein n=1 Tax=Geothrix sp. 21YS21S-4 TaxID=3068889 RepID=UPI0027B95E62|nr:hypothetical protein [Geothrix sp. 21YS21S-4]